MIASQVDATKTFDPFTLEVLWARSIAIADEMAAALIRTGFSTAISVTLDYACGIFDGRGELLAQATHCAPGQLGSMPTVMHEFLRVYPADTLQPGDVLITNDPWIGSGHNPDIYLAEPIFFEGRLVGFACNSAHHMDIGGTVGFDRRDVHQEGLLIPICKLYEAGRVNEMLLRLIQQNVRLPENTMGDLRAQLAANHVAAGRVQQMVAEYELDGLEDLSAAIIAETERAMRYSVSKIPNGTYVTEYPLEDRGRYGEPLAIRLAMTIADGEATMDFTGSSPQVDLPINCVLNYTVAYCVVGLKMAVDPDLPYNAGTQRPVTVVVPEANLLNAKYPIAVGHRTTVGQLIPEVIFGALAEVAAERVIAGCGSLPAWGFGIHGRRPDGKPFHVSSRVYGGLGARSYKDGTSTVTFPGSTASTPSEVIEREAGVVLVDGREFVTDSGGPGTYRGGLGQRITLRMRRDVVATNAPQRMLVSVKGGRFEEGAPGLLGGQAGGLGGVFHNGKAMPIDQPDFELSPGDEVTLLLPGGGGMYAPGERDPELVLADVAQGYVSPQQARDVYAVALDPQTGALDAAATAQLRGQRSAG